MGRPRLKATGAHILLGVGAALIVIGAYLLWCVGGALLAAGVLLFLYALLVVDVASPSAATGDPRLGG